ncbi:Nn.00g012270.m01.CDS01 [Neocucurbitaria sp. VM-36]
MKLSGELQTIINSNDANALEAHLSRDPALDQEELNKCLELAMPDGSLDTIRVLLQHGSKLNVFAYSKAIAREDPAVFQLLIDHGWDINSTEFENSAVHSSLSHPNLLRWLLEHGADPNTMSSRMRGSCSQRRTPLIAASRYNDPTTALEILLSHGAELDPMAMFSPIGGRMRGNGIAAMRVLLDHGADVNGYNDEPLAATPTLTGSRILFTEPANPNDGVDIVLSDELRANIDKAIASSCKTVDNQCVENIRGLLINPQTELEARQLIAAGAGLFALLALAIPLYEKERSQGVPIAFHIPSSQLDPAASAAQASTIAAIMASGSPIITITQKPDAASATATDAPRQTTLSGPQDGHSPGDVAIYLSDDLARRLTEMIERSRQCTAGDAFPSNKRFRRRDGEEAYGEVICAAEQLVLNSAQGAAFADLAQFQGQQPAWTSPELMQAMGEVTTFAATKASLMKLPKDAAAPLAYVSVMLAFVVLVMKQPLSNINWIPGIALRGTITQSAISTTISIIPTNSIATTTAESTSSMFECLATCKIIGHMGRCSTQCPTATGAPAIKPTHYAVKTVSIEPWVVPYLPQTPLQAPVGICMAAEATDFPIEHFPKAYSDFCNQADQSTSDVSWTVNAQGQQSAPKLRRYMPRDLADADKYKDYSFTLWWRPVAGGTECSLSCKDAFEELVESDSCKQGSSKSNLAARGSIDVGCGSYSFAINSKPQFPKTPITCRNHPLSAPKHDGNANGATSVEAAIQRWCSDNDGHALTKDAGNDIIYWRWGITQLDVPNRSSFWLRANLNDDNKQGNLVKDECIAAFTDSLSQCDADKDVTHGFTASVGSIDYSLDLSGVTVDGNPPWNEKPAFPAPEFAPGKDLGGAAQSPSCYPPDAELGRKISQADLESAMDAFCVNGADIQGFGYHWDKMFRYPPTEQPQFYNSEASKMHLEMGAETINHGAKEPYDDMRWCNGYDWKMGKDDCLFALRRLFETCNTKPDKFIAGEYTYRCVHYKVFHINER